LGLGVLAGGISSALAPQLRTAVLIIPIPLGILLGVALYFRFAHEAVKYDETGFEVTRGGRVALSSEWNRYAEVSLLADPKRGVNLRLYLQPDGEHVDIPGTKVGIDPFSLRNTLRDRLRKQQ
jgi:hypothetical protein